MSWKRPVPVDIYDRFGNDHIACAVFLRIYLAAQEVAAEEPVPFKGRFINVNRGDTIIPSTEWATYFGLTKSGFSRVLKRIADRYNAIKIASHNGIVIAQILGFDSMANLKPSQQHNQQLSQQLSDPYSQQLSQQLSPEQNVPSENKASQQSSQQLSDTPSQQHNQQPSQQLRARAYKDISLDKSDKERSPTLTSRSPKESSGELSLAVLRKRFGKMKFEKFRKSGVPLYVSVAVDLWNDFAPGEGLATVRQVSPKLAAKIRQRLQSGAFNWGDICDAIRKSSFCHGDNDAGWRVDFRWIFENDENYRKLSIERRYENQKTVPKGLMVNFLERNKGDTIILQEEQNVKTNFG